MRPIAAAFVLLLDPFALPLHAQTVCAQPPVATWTVQFFERWQDAVAKMVANAAYDDTMTLLPVRSGTKNGYLVAFEKVIHFTNDCPPRPLGYVEENTAGWRRELIDSPALAEAFAASLPAGTPVGMMTLHAGYSAGPVPPSGGRRRSATHSTVSFPPRGVVVMWYDGQ